MKKKSDYILTIFLFSLSQIFLIEKQLSACFFKSYCNNCFKYTEFDFGFTGVVGIHLSLILKFPTMYTFDEVWNLQTRFLYSYLNKGSKWTNLIFLLMLKSF